MKIDNWKTVRLGDVATYINGYAFKPSDWTNDGLPIIRIQNLTGNDYETNFFNGEVPEKFHIEKGDVLISWSASLGVYEWKKGDALLNQHIFKVVFDKIDVDKTYFMFTVSNLLNAMAKQTHGSTMRHITKPDFDNMPFPLPPLEIQRQIAAQLDKCTAVIAKHKQMLEKYDTLIKSQFVEMFGDNPIDNGKWKVESFGNIGSCKNGMNFHYDENGIEINCLGVSDFKDNSVVDCDSLPKISLNEAPTNEYLLKNEDIVFVRSNGNKELVGRSVIVYPKTPTTFSGFCIRFRKNYDELNSIFLLRYLKTEYARKKMAGRGANIQNLNQQILSELQIPVPPLALQEKFAQFVQAVDAQKAKTQQSLEKAETLYKSLMQDYFG